MRANGNPVHVCDDQTRELERVGLARRGEGEFDEAWLQRLIHQHPACLPVRDIEPGLGDLISICREFPTKHGRIDNVLVTPDGDIVLVETKLWRNPEARREVIAQALDYASCVFEMDYSDFEAAALSGDFGNRPKPDRLYDLLPEAEAHDLPAFVDAVNTNLQRGRALILVAGDGIKTETERLAASLQSHAGFHFTFGLIELAVYVAPDGMGYIVHPRTLTKTRIIDRGIIHIDDKRAVVTLAPPSAGVRMPKAIDITEEQFYETMAARNPILPDRLREFLERLENLGVYPEFKRSLNLKWEPPNGKPINLGYIQRNGQVWTEAANWFAPTDLSHAYIGELASVVNGEVEKEQLGGSWHVRINGKAPRIEAIVDKLDGWYRAIGNFIEACRNWHAE